jgi:murein DD-endopeptidase MepM/ murein hydrolase activator NlpD
LSSHRAVASRLSAASRRGAVDIGEDAPLAAVGVTPALDRRDVNLRWLGASVLTGLTGASLIGAAIWVSLQGEVTFAELPERASPLPRPQPSEGGSNAARKGDRLVRASMVALAKQSFRAPVTQRIGDREVVKVRPFVRIATGLSLTTGTYASDIPSFDPLKLFAESAPERAPEAPADATDAEITLVKRDLAEVVVASGAVALSDEEVAALVEEERRLAAEAGRRAAVPIAPQLLLSRTLRAPMASPTDEPGPRGLGAGLGTYGPVLDSGPFKSIEVRVVPENVTSFAKTEPRASEAPIVEERDLALKRGETIEALLRENGAGPDAVRGIVAALGGRARAGTLAEGQQMRVQVAPGARPSDGRGITRVALYGEGGIEAIAAMNDRGAFVSVAPPVEEGTTRRAAPQPAEGEDDEEGGVRLFASLHETILRQDLPRGVVDELVRIFAYDLDFQRRVAAGDALELLYTFDEEGGAGPERPEILYAALTVGGEARRVYRFLSPDDGTVDYFDEGGRSLKKFLLRKPIADGVMRSGFGYRRHPVLGYARMHTGVDWSNPVGTPIMAAGNGTVVKAEWDSGYGRRVEIQHLNGYLTTYNHMSRFGRGVQAGARVRQGQIIGYVGSTGLSTGAHLHYEVAVNGHLVDPMKIRMPRGRELEGRQLVDFRRQREQVDGLIQTAGTASRDTAQRAAMR